MGVPELRFPTEPVQAGPLCELAARPRGNSESVFTYLGSGLRLLPHILVRDQ